MQPALPRRKPFQGVAALAAALLSVSATGCTSAPAPPASSGPDIRIAAVGDMNAVNNLEPDSPSGRTDFGGEPQELPGRIVGQDGGRRSAVIGRLD